MKYLGLEISKLRFEVGMSQKELARDICTQSTISRIESGEVFPAIDTLLKIALKLQVPIEYFIEMLFQKNVLESEKLIKTIELLLKEHKYQEVVSMIYKTEMVKENVWLNTYLEYLLNTAHYNLKVITATQCIENMKKMLSFSNQTTIQFRFLNIKISNTLANIYAENGDQNKSLYYYDKILKEHVHKNYNDFKITETLVVVLYNKCKALYDLTRIDDALETANQGIEKAKETGFVNYAGQFLYYKGQCLEKKNAPFEDIQEVYMQALFIFQFLRFPFYIQAITVNKKQYLK